MKIKYNKSNLRLGLVVFAILFVGIHCCYLFQFSGVMEVVGYSPHFVVIVCITLLVWYLTKSLSSRKLRSIYGPDHLWFRRYIGLLCLCLLVMMIYSSIKYPQQDLFATLRQASPQFAMLAAPFFTYYCMKAKQMNSLMKIMNFVSFLWYFILMIQSVYYLRTGTFLFDFSSVFSDDVSMRNGGIKVSLYGVGDIMILYNFVVLFCVNKCRLSEKVFSIIQFVLGLYCLLIIQQSRINSLVVVVCVLSIALLKNQNKRRVILNIALIGIIFVIVFFSPQFSDFLQSFSLNSDMGVSTKYRLYSFGYFWDCFLKNPLFGNGFASGDSTQPYSYIEHSSLGIAYYNDDGFVGLLANIGLMSVVTFIIPLVRMIKNTKVVWNNSNSDLYKFMSFAAVEYFILSSVTLLVFTLPNRVMIFPMMFGFVEACKLFTIERRDI